MLKKFINFFVIFYYFKILLLKVYPLFIEFKLLKKIIVPNGILPNTIFLISKL